MTTLPNKEKYDPPMPPVVSPAPTGTPMAAVKNLNGAWAWPSSDYKGAESTLCLGCGHDAISSRDH